MPVLFIYSSFDSDKWNPYMQYFAAIRNKNLNPLKLSEKAHAEWEQNKCPCEVGAATIDAFEISTERCWKMKRD